MTHFRKINIFRSLLFINKILGLSTTCTLQSETEQTLKSFLIDHLSKTNRKSSLSLGQGEKDEIELLLKFVEGHQRCGAECVHLKRFYAKMGWNGGERWKMEMKPKKTIIDTLPLIRKRKV